MKTFTRISLDVIVIVVATFFALSYKFWIVAAGNLGFMISFFGAAIVVIASVVLVYDIIMLKKR